VEGGIAVLLAEIRTRDLRGAHHSTEAFSIGSEGDIRALESTRAHVGHRRLPKKTSVGM